MVREKGGRGGLEVVREGGMVADDARPTGTLTHLPSDSGTAFGPSRSTRCVYLPTILRLVIMCTTMCTQR